MKGALRVIGDGARCKSGETPISWNEKGAKGEAGAKGEVGAQGAAGAAGAAGTKGDQGATGPQGGKAEPATLENVDLAVASFMISYRPRAPNGTFGTTQNYGWDRTTNQPVDPLPY